MDMQRGQRDKLEKYINISEEFTALVMIKGESPCKFVCLGVDENEVIVNYNYMISAVKKETPNAEIRYSPIQNGAAFKIKLAALPQNINKLVFAVGLDGEGVMSDTENFMVRVGQNRQVAISMTLTGSDFGDEKSIVLFEIYLKSDAWRFWAVVSGYKDNLSSLIKRYFPSTDNAKGEISSEPTNKPAEPKARATNLAKAEPIQADISQNIAQGTQPNNKDKLKQAKEMLKNSEDLSAIKLFRELEKENALDVESKLMLGEFFTFGNKDIPANTDIANLYLKSAWEDSNGKLKKDGIDIIIKFIRKILQDEHKLSVALEWADKIPPEKYMDICRVIKSSLYREVNFYIAEYYNIWQMYNKDKKHDKKYDKKLAIPHYEIAAVTGIEDASNMLVWFYGSSKNKVVEHNPLLRLRWLSEHKRNVKVLLLSESGSTFASSLDDYVSVMQEEEAVFRIAGDKITLTQEVKESVAVYSYFWFNQIFAITNFQLACASLQIDKINENQLERMKNLADKILTNFAEFMVKVLSQYDNQGKLDKPLLDKSDFGISARNFLRNFYESITVSEYIEDTYLNDINEIYRNVFDVLINSALGDANDAYLTLFGRKDYQGYNSDNLLNNRKLIEKYSLGLVGAIAIFAQEALLELNMPLLNSDNIKRSKELEKEAKNGKYSLTESVEFLTAALKTNPWNGEIYKNLSKLYGDKKEDLAIIASYVHIEGYFKKVCAKYINNDIQKRIDNLNNITITKKLQTTPKPSVIQPPAKQVSVPQYNSVTKINGGYNFNILGKYKFSLSDANADYMRFCWNFFNTTLALSESLEKNAGEIKNYDLMIGSPQAVTLALKNLIDFYIETFLIKQGIFEYDQSYFFNPIEEDLILEFKDFFAAEETVQNYQRQLQIAHDNRSRWQGGGFGITGAIKGAIKAEILNVGADMASGLFKTITGTTNADKVRNLKSKLYKEIYVANPNLLAKRFNNVAVMLIDPFYEVLIRHGKANGNLSLNKRGAVARFDNVTRLYNKGEYDKDKAIGELARCFESNPGYFECGLAIAQLEPRIIKELLKALTGGNNFEHIERNIFNMLSYAKIARLQKYSSDANILRNASMAAFNQDEFNFIIENKLYEARKERVIYIVDTEVVIPLELKDMKYVGLGEARCYINHPTIIFFERLGLTFENIKFDKKYENLIKNYNQFYDALALIDKKNYASGLEIIKETAKDGYDDANYFLYWIYSEGALGEKKDENQAKSYFQKVNIDNVCNSLLWLSLALISGEHDGFNIDDDKAISFLNLYLRKKYIAVNGEKTACRILGSLYADKKDVQNAAKFLDRAIDFGDAFSIYARAMLGDLDAIKEFEYLEKAAELGVPEASYKLGTRAEDGFDRLEGMGDINNAINYYKQAADKNYAPALLKLGQIYIEGKGTDKRPIAAADYFERAYNLGDMKAAVELGICYANGEGVELDYEKAFELHKAAAYTGDADGAYNLGLCYYYGAGTKKDIKMAKDWLEEALKRGSLDAKQTVADLFKGE